MAAKNTVKATKSKKKQWVRIIAPKIFNEVVIGETPLWDEEDLADKIVPANLMSLTNDMRAQSTTVKFTVLSIENKIVKTKVKSYEVSGSSIKRLVRRGTNIIESSMVLKCKDDSPVRIKPLVLTRGHTHSSVQKALRNLIRTNLTASVAKLGPDELVTQVIGRRLQNELKASLKKTHPIKAVEIKKFEFVKPLN